jgi:hypothetical protein
MVLPDRAFHGTQHSISVVRCLEDGLLHTTLFAIRPFILKHPVRSATFASKQPNPRCIQSSYPFPGCAGGTQSPTASISASMALIITFYGRATQSTLGGQCFVVDRPSGRNSCPPIGGAETSRSELSRSRCGSRLPASMLTENGTVFTALPPAAADAARSSSSSPPWTSPSDRSCDGLYGSRTLAE